MKTAAWAQRLFYLSYETDERSRRGRLIAKVARRALASLNHRGALPVRYRLEGIDILLPSDHRLPLYQNWFAQHGGQLKRLAEAVLLDRPEKSYVDIGANVGDTAAVVRSAVRNPILCIEGSATYQPFLIENSAILGPDVAIETSYVGPDDSGIVGVEVMSGGTGRIVAGDGAARIRTRSMSSIMADHAGLSDCGLIKVDTDGHDYAILCGSLDWLSSQRPTVLFEYAPRFAVPNGPTGPDTLRALAGIGYSGALWYDNTGELLWVSHVADHGAIAQLDRLLSSYGQTYRGHLVDCHALRYADVVAFHSDERATFEAFSSAEIIRQRTAPSAAQR